jgi:hypothetical protein
VVVVEDVLVVVDVELDVVVVVVGGIVVDVVVVVIGQEFTNVQNITFKDGF